MSPRRHESEGNAERRSLPSGVSRDRLAAGVSGDVADLRMQLEETILRSEAFLAAGFPDQASAVVDEQQALLAELHERIDSRISAAKVEADAEAVLADTLESYGREGVDELVGADTGGGDSRVAPLRAARGAASALVGAVAAIALMVMASSPPGPNTFAAAGVRDDRDATLVPEDGPDATASDDSVEGVEPQARPTTEDSQRASGPNDLEIRKLFATPGTTEPSEDDDEADEPGLPVLQLQALVANVVSTVEGVAEAARDGWERAFDEDRRPQQAEDETAEEDGEGESVEVAEQVDPADGEQAEAEAEKPAAEEPTEESADETPQDDADGSDASSNEGGDVEDRVGTTVRDLS